MHVASHDLFNTKLQTCLTQAWILLSSQSIRVRNPQIHPVNFVRYQ
jgi:hypothetical protein